MPTISLQVTSAIAPILLVEQRPWQHQLLHVPTLQYCWVLLTAISRVVVFDHVFSRGDP